MTLSAEELGIRVVLISCTWLLSIQTTQLSPFLHNQGEIVWTCWVWEIQVSTSGFELEFSPPQLNALPLSYDAPYFYLYLLPFWATTPLTFTFTFTFSYHWSKVNTRPINHGLHETGKTSPSPPLIICYFKKHLLFILDGLYSYS